MMIEPVSRRAPPGLPSTAGTAVAAALARAASIASDWSWADGRSDLGIASPTGTPSTRSHSLRP